MHNYKHRHHFHHHLGGKVQEDVEAEEVDGLEVVAGAAVDLEDEEGEVDCQQGLDVVTRGQVS